MPLPTYTELSSHPHGLTQQERYDWNRRQRGCYVGRIPANAKGHLFVPGESRLRHGQRKLPRSSVGPSEEMAEQGEFYHRPGEHRWCQTCGRVQMIPVEGI